MDFNTAPSRVFFREYEDALKILKGNEFSFLYGTMYPGQKVRIYRWQVTLNPGSGWVRDEYRGEVYLHEKLSCFSGNIENWVVLDGRGRPFNTLVCHEDVVIH